MGGRDVDFALKNVMLRTSSVDEPKLKICLRFYFLSSFLSGSSNWSSGTFFMLEELSFFGEKWILFSFFEVVKA